VLGAPAATFRRDDDAALDGSACSVSVPQDWHFGQRPTHWAALCPHSVQT